jgi:hypothetical protein
VKGGGPIWKTWQKIQYAKEKEWYGFGGAWGDRSTKSTQLGPIDNYGPPGPGPVTSKSAKNVPEGW